MSIVLKSGCIHCNHGNLNTGRISDKVVISKIKKL